MKAISTRKLKTYLLLIFLGISIYGATLDVLLSSSNFREGLDLYNYDKVYADSTDSGFNFFTDYFVLASAVTGSYVTFDVSGYIPAGSTGAIIEVVNNFSPYAGYYLRHPDSTDDHYVTSGLAGDNHVYHVVAVNSSLCFEAKKQSVNIVYYLIGYTDSNIILETNLPDYSLGITTSWEDVDLSADVPAGATGVLMMFKTDTSGWESGVRHPDSTDAFKGDTIGLSPAFCGVNSSRMIEAYIENVGVDLYLVGYATDPVTFITNWDDVSLGATGSYLDVDVTAETVADATGVLIYVDHTSVTPYDGALREDGSTNDLYGDTKGYAKGYVAGLVGLGSGEIFEGKIASLTVNFYVIGYVEEGGVANEVFPDHVEDSYLVTNATHTLLNNDTFAVIDAVGWIEWDFGYAVANVTRINWDLVYSQTGSNFRIEGSVDGVSWTPLVHTDPNKVGSPPSNNYFYSRYDSEMHTRYRYYRIMAVYNVVVDWYLDSFWLTIQPPAIVYDDGTYVYPSELQYSNFGPSYTRLRPYGTLGKNETSTAVIGINGSSAVVNSDHSANNYLIVKFSDYYNITVAQVHARQSSSNMHFYLYMSTTGESGDWTRVGDWAGIQGAGWYGATINGTRIRYMLVNCTGVGAQYLEVEAFRIVGDIHTGEGVDDDEDEFDFGGLPDWIADLLGITAEAGGFIASLILMTAFLLPIAVYDRKGIIALIVGVSVLGLCVLLTWLPSWIMLLTILLVAGVFAFNFSRWFGGR